MSSREQKIINTGLLGIFMNVSLVALKGTIGFLSGSIAVVLDALNNLTDVLSALVTVIGTKLAHRAPDKNHPFGHGRFEDLTAFVVGFIILAAGVGAVASAAPHLLEPTSTDYSPVSILLIFLAVIAKLLFSRRARRVGNDLNSASLVATGTDAFFDALITFATFVSALLARFLDINIEGFVGIVIGAFIIKNAVEVILETTKKLVGSRADAALSKKIKRAVARFPGVEGTYDLMLHSYGPVDMFGSIHIQVPDKMTAKEIHQLSRDISEKIYKTYGVLLTIGIYAKNTDEKEYDALHSKLLEIVNDYPEVLQVHGFYVDKKSHTVAFDLVLGFECKDREEIRDHVIGSLKSAFPNYQYQVILDLDSSD